MVTKTLAVIVLCGIGAAAHAQNYMTPNAYSPFVRQAPVYVPPTPPVYRPAPPVYVPAPQYRQDPAVRNDCLVWGRC